MVMKSLATAAFSLFMVFIGSSPFTAAAAAPSVSNVSGTFTNRSTITITGSGFGTKSPAKPLCFADFEDGAVDCEASLSSGQGHLNPSGSAQLCTTNQQPNSHYNVCNIVSNGSVRVEADLNSGSSAYWYMFEKRYYGASNWWTYQKSSGNVNYKWARNWPAQGQTPDFIASVNSEFCVWPGTGFAVEKGNGTSETCASALPPTMQWNVEEIQGYEGTLNNTDGQVCPWMNGQLIGGQCYKLAFVTTSYPSYMNDWGFENFWEIVSPPAGAYVWMDDDYFDITWARVMICDTSTWTTCTNREIQIPTAWSDSSITITLNQGSFANLNNTYLYVIDSNGNVNPNGFPLCPSCPQPPKNLAVQ